MFAWFKDIAAKAKEHIKEKFCDDDSDLDYVIVNNIRYKLNKPKDKAASDDIIDLISSSLPGIAKEYIKRKLSSK